MEHKTFSAGTILIPEGIDDQKWSVVACDQYTSEPEYWQNVSEIVGDNPSTLNTILPEVYLENDGVDERIKEIHKTMEKYLSDGFLKPFDDSLVYIERTLKDGNVRRGLIGLIDLETYDFSVGSQSLVRATEGTVLSRIPPRAKVRRGAPLEFPHIMLLIDDDKKTVIEPLTLKKSFFENLYDFDLMCDGGHITGYRISGENLSDIYSALDSLADQTLFESKYGVRGKGVLQFAVGDGNHSLATAKRCFEELKETMPEAEWSVHPARYAMVEVVNLHDDALEFEAIHRVVFGVDSEDMLKSLANYYDISNTPCEGQSFDYITASGKGTLWIKNPHSNLTVGSLQEFIDSYIAEKGGKVDYIHGAEVTESLAKQSGNIGFILPDMPKSELFRTVILDGALPRKTFSMGHAYDKRFYFESRRIK